MTISKLELEKMGYSLIPISDILITPDPDKTIGYDMTVDDYFTFATHDGVFIQDTMAMYAPMSEEAQKEAKSKMISATRNSGINAPMFDLSNEMISGLFSITYPELKDSPQKISTLEEAKLLPFGKSVIFKGNNTTAGRVIFNSGLPDGFPFVNESITKGGVKKILARVMEKSQTDFVHSVDRLMDMGFYYATVNPLSYSIDQMTLSSELIQMKKKLASEKDVSMQSKIIKQMEDALLEHLRKEVPELFMTAFSGASKDVGQLRQIMVCKGLIADPSGNILPPIMTAITDGYNTEEYFAASAGSRTGTISRAILTAHGGYSARKVMFVSSNVTLSTTTKNCNTKEGLDIKLTPRLFDKMRGRYVIGEDGDVHPIDAKMIGQKIKLRSPVRCKSNELCHICYGELHKQLDTRNVGITAALNLNVAEKIMKCSVGLIEKDNRLLSFDDVWENIQWSEN